MNRGEAIEAVVEKWGGTPMFRHSTLATFQFPSLADADEAKQIIDALAPGATGAVFFTGRLVVELSA